MPPIRAVTFDCAETLLSVRWNPGRFAVRCAEEAGVAVPDGAEDPYNALFLARQARFLEENLRGSDATRRAFWADLGRDWLQGLGLDPALEERVAGVSERLLYGPSTEVFALFDDVRPTLEALAERGVSMAVVSNWDWSLLRVLRSFDLDGFFDPILASLERGYEKPDPRLFKDAVDALRVAPEETLHVGDNPIDDLQGAREFGMRAVLIDRSRRDAAPPYIASLQGVVAMVDASR